MDMKKGVGQAIPGYLYIQLNALPTTRGIVPAAAAAAAAAASAGWYH